MRNILKEYPSIRAAIIYSIEYIRGERRISTEAIARQTGISRVALSYFLHGKLLISQDTARRIAVVLGMESVEDLAVYPYLQMCREERDKNKKNNKNKKPNKKTIKR